MLLTRRLNERTLLLQRQGRIGFCVDSSGQEACEVGGVFALTPYDWIFPYYRDAGMCLARGVPTSVLMNHIMTNASDTSKGRQLGVQWSFKDFNIVSSSSCVASRLAHAVGTAYAMKYKKDRLVCLVSFGDGATSQGEFHAALNFAGAWKVPVVFLCENNQYAISLPERYQTASRSIAIKAEAYGFDGIQIDGNYILAVYSAVRSAVDSARSGGGATLIEAITYRQGGHSSSDDPTRYRGNEELDYWKTKDPIPRFKQYLSRKGLITEPEGAEISESVEKEIVESVRSSEKIPRPSLSTLFSDVYQEMPWHIKEELDEAGASEP